MPRPDFFTITLFTAETAAAAAAKQPARRLAAPTSTPPVRRRCQGASRVLQLLADHRPAEVLEKAALAAIDQAYAALLEIAPPEGGQRVLEASAPVDPADPYSPLLRLEASPTHCRVTSSLPAGGGRAALAPERIKNLHPGLTRASVGVSPGALHLARVVAVPSGGGDRRVITWSYAEARPDASSEGLLRAVRTVRSRLDEAIARETTLLEMVRAGGFGRSPKAEGIVAARAALEEMRAVLDVDAIVRGKGCCQKRRRRHPREVISSCCPRPAAEMEDAEMLSSRIWALRMDEVEDDAEVLVKRLRTLRV
ncbi:hypothetical protein PVAP13_5KG242300 [Panicum virgatum]|uniref:Uncharacterized protein n=1 Tax=Panicum virgatum TaxID=38727 RepID=A0A8T0SEH9_PANVG|nr:hypothetical protein PVAP13_5KG242300 [Panicum virgatum]